MASGKLIFLAVTAGVLSAFSIAAPPTVALLGVQSSGTLRGPSALLASLTERGRTVEDASREGKCGPSLGSSSAFFGGGVLCGMIITVLAVGVLSDRNLTSAKPSRALGEKKGEPAANDPEPEPGTTDAVGASSLRADGCAQAKHPQDLPEIYDNIQNFWPRCSCLAFLLVVQSGSSIILSNFESLVHEHTSLVYFLTMLVGLGGNAGVQSVVLAVRRFAADEEVSVSEQFYMGVKLAAVLAPLAFLRCRLQGTSMDVCVTVGIASVILIVLATTLGTSLTLLLQRFRMDPAHASPTIQVIMDMAGLLIACSLGWTIMTFLAA